MAMMNILGSKVYPLIKTIILANFYNLKDEEYELIDYQNDGVEMCLSLMMKTKRCKV